VGGTGQDAEPGRILVADDDEALRSTLVDLLIGEGYTVIQARDGDEALAAMTGPAPPELALLDVKMPGMDGLDVLRRLRERRASVGVIMLTAYGTPNLAILSMQLGAYGYITKPLDADEVLVTVKRWFEHRAAMRSIQRSEATPGEDAAPEDRTTVLAEAVALLLRREVERAERAGAEDAIELRALLIRLERGLDGSPAGGRA
jgi:DNA-binding response OmpR family regulator